MAKIKQVNAEGVEEEIEVFTPEEVDAKLQEKDKVLAEKDTTLNSLANEKKELEEKLSKMAVDGIKEDHPNFKVLKEALSKKDSEIQSLRTEFENDKKQRAEEAFETKIKLLAKGDTELEKKIKLHLTTTLVGMKEDNDEARQKKIEAAYKLSSDTSLEGPGIFDMGVGGSGKGSEFKDGGVNTVEFTARERALGAKLGITAEDYKKYGSRVSKKN